jgi:hypothetical protein
MKIHYEGVGVVLGTMDYDLTLLVRIIISNVEALVLQVTDGRWTYSQMATLTSYNISGVQNNYKESPLDSRILIPFLLHDP